MFIKAYERIPENKSEDYQAFINRCGIQDEKDSDYTVLFYNDSGDIAACGSLCGNVLKQIAVDGTFEGKGLCARVVSELTAEAVRRGKSHLFIYTKPKNRELFTSLGFTGLVETEEILMMENRRNGLEKFLTSVRNEAGKRYEDVPSACIVCNCDPVTKGHLYLIEKAAAENEHLYVFVLSEEGSASFYIPPEDRFRLVREAVGTPDSSNVTVCRSRDYLISRATFPAYFLKGSVDPEQARSDLDLYLFAERIAPALKINKRYVGTEPFCSVTESYNKRMKEILPARGIGVIEVPRYRAISASRVREAVLKGEPESVRDLVPENVYEYLSRRTKCPDDRDKE